jgi:hypothetical protein
MLQVQTNQEAQMEAQAIMSRSELERFLDEQTFQPFVLTTVDGFSIPVPSLRRVLLGLRMVVIADGYGRLYNVPFRAISHISEAGKELG